MPLSVRRNVQLLKNQCVHVANVVCAWRNDYAPITLKIMCRCAFAKDICSLRVEFEQYFMVQIIKLRTPEIVRVFSQIQISLKIHTDI